MRQREQLLLPDKVQWVASIGEIAPVTGVVLSNELLDNFSVHQVVMEDELMEVFVEYEDGFREVLRPANEALKNYLHQLGVVLPRGYRTEINLEATDWIKEISAGLQKGFILTIDYGYPSSVLYGRKDGTLICYHGHRINHNPYDLIGQQDITSHVNFSALDYWGRMNGLECCGYTTQTHFLQGLGITNHLQKIEAAGPEDHDPATRQQRMWRMRMLLLEMGRKFKVLIQRKGLDKVLLSGMQFSQTLG
jgi:SAM-dependent MidA family methyltransferase